MLKWKPNICASQVEVAFNLHKSFQQHIPSVISVSEGRTFTGGQDGCGAYPGEHGVNKGFHSAIEIIADVTSMDSLKKDVWNHPHHVAAAERIDPLIEDAWAIDWLEDRNALVLPSAGSESFVKHVVFFKWKEDATRQQRDNVLTAWKGLPAQMPDVMAVSCGDALVADKARGFHTGLVSDIKLKGDGIDELNRYHVDEAVKHVSKTYLKPIVAGFVVMDFSEHR